ncbi:MAG: 50S ribosomal protein L6 [Eubacteriales bacterium]|nr:50S ribosomal protein L6 [Eubacteriales bacterium]
MSRIGKKPITIPAGVEVKLQDGVMEVKKGQIVVTEKIHPDMQVQIENNVITVSRPSDSKLHRSLHGLTRSLINNMVVGVNESFKKVLEVNGIGYRAALEGTELVLTVGLSHPVRIPQPEGITFEVPKQSQIIVSGANKQVVGETAAKIRAVRPPEPYKGKGIKYDYETIRLKEGKTGAAK